MKQDMLLGILSGLYQNLFVVGDDDQNIYTWRGSDPAYMINLIRHMKMLRIIILLRISEVYHR